ncbi:hypothetical protein D9615_002930 [Tricholomella constricta]|uniref:Bud22 domain-containing protein n=1 Tax=Tricholomella constricta TaxID=117010 RepID=A0A8H5HG92_9AGAR|nr:hypothetical protein D9615_002930 [Tricholomella constricta]
MPFKRPKKLSFQNFFFYRCHINLARSRDRRDEFKIDDLLWITSAVCPLPIDHLCNALRTEFFFCFHPTLPRIEPCSCLNMAGSAAIRGLKRKRYEPPAQDLGVKIGGKLHHDLKEVKQAAKKAKTFETQKLIKKLKDLRKKGENLNEVTEAEGQLESLKDLNHELIATTALKTKLNKVRMLQENEHVQAAISEELTGNFVPAATGTAAAKVQSRLLSSKLLATEIAAVVEGLKNLLQPKTDPLNSGDEEDIPATERPKKLKKLDSVKEKVPARGLQAVDGAPVDADDEENEDEEIDDAGWESGTVSDDVQRAQDSWESGSISGEDDGDSAEESDDDEEELAVVPSSTKKALPPKAPSTKTSTKKTGLQSTFLPSLSVGFTRGESDDSDLSESEIKAADIDIKKNRRGQRARRAIWEKKFGRNANHKKKEAEQNKETVGRGLERRHPTNAMHPSNRSFNKGPARSQADIRSVPQYRQEADSGWGQRTAAAQRSAPQKAAPPARSFAKGRVEEKPLHPSWEAKKKLKERERTGIVPSQGKKIKFS